MNQPNSRQLWQSLQDRGLVEGDMPPAMGSSPPWYVRMMLGAAGWIGALFLIGFVVIAFREVMNGPAASMAVGASGCVAAFGIFRLARENDFGTQFGLAVSFAGQTLFAVGLYKTFEHDTLAAHFMMFAFLTALAAIVPNFIHRVLATWAAMFVFSLFLGGASLHVLAAGIAGAGCAVIWLNELRWPASATLWRPIGYGLVLALLQVDAMNLFGHGLWRELFGHKSDAGWLQLHAQLIGTSLVAVIFAWVVTRLLARERLPLTSGAGISALAAALLVAALSFAAPGAATALMIILLGFASGNRVLIGLGMLALGGFLSHYYYQLQNTLMFKSMVLGGSGAVLLLARLALQKLFPIRSAKENSDA
jgi:uncharacterized membrane protein